jgi:hypothetical protein
MINLDTITSADENTFKVAVAFDDNGDATAGFVIVSKDSDQYRSAAHKLRKAGIKRAAVKNQRIDTKTDEGAEQFDNLMQTSELELAVSVVVDWFGFTKGDVPAPFDPATVRAALVKRPTWREKITASLENETNFLPSSSQTSAPTPATSSDSASETATA